MMETEEDKQKLIDKLEAQVAALTLSVKAANKQYQGSALKYEALDQKYKELDADHSKTLDDHSKTLEDYNRLLAFVDSLKENISIDKCMLWAAKTEKQSSKELKQLRKDLADYTIANQERTRDLDIAEADAPPQSSNDAVIAEILGDKPQKLESGKKR